MNPSLRCIGLCVLLFVPVTQAWASEDGATIESPARARMLRGVELYREGRFEEALAELEASRRIEVLRAIDYKIGRCRERLGDLPGAIEAYERFLRIEPSARQAEAVRLRIVTLRDREDDDAPDPIVAAPIAPVRIAVIPPRVTPAVGDPIREGYRRAVARGVMPREVLAITPDELEQRLAVAPELLDCADEACAARVVVLAGASRVVLTDVEQLGKRYRIRVRAFAPGPQLVGEAVERCEVCTHTETAQAIERAATRATTETTPPPTLSVHASR